MSDDVGDQFQPNISLTTPVEDYKKHIKEKIQCDELVDDEELQQNYAKIAAKMREVIWNLLFAEEPAKAENLSKASECLYQHKIDAGFYSPWDYNAWISTVRDELLKRKMFDFWREEMVQRELGPCWARDSDYFDDLDDEEPAAFYKHAGCVATFSKETS